VTGRFGIVTADFGDRDRRAKWRGCVDFGCSKLALLKWFLAMHLLTRAKKNVSTLKRNRAGKRRGAYLISRAETKAQTGPAADYLAATPPIGFGSSERR
jgi:hypothetical protein